MQNYLEVGRDVVTMHDKHPWAHLTSAGDAFLTSCNFSRWLAWWQHRCCHPLAPWCSLSSTPCPLPSCWSWLARRREEHSPGKFEGWGKLSDTDDDNDGDEDGQDDLHLVVSLSQDHHSCSFKWRRLVTTAEGKLARVFEWLLKNWISQKSGNYFSWKVQLHLSGTWLSICEYSPLHRLKLFRIYTSKDCSVSAFFFFFFYTVLDQLWLHCQRRTTKTAFIRLYPVRF